MQGAGGLMSVTGEPGGRPLKAGVAETDIIAGTNAALAITAALLDRERRRASGHAQAETAPRHREDQARRDRGRDDQGRHDEAADERATPTPRRTVPAPGRSADNGVEGTYLDVGLFDGQVSLMGYHLVGHLISGRVPQPAGNALPYIVPYQAFRTANGEITVAVNGTSASPPTATACAAEPSWCPSWKPNS
jgi:crotonobetainyl-CoA:carnitine CoA-transferase CaiB-like acyl-CoA transferase